MCRYALMIIYCDCMCMHMSVEARGWPQASFQEASILLIETSLLLSPRACCFDWGRAISHRDLPNCSSPVLRLPTHTVTKHCFDLRQHLTMYPRLIWHILHRTAWP